MAISRLDPRRIISNFRLQTLIDEEIAIANQIMKDNPDINELDSKTLIDLGLTYLEIGDWQTVQLVTAKALEKEWAKQATMQDYEIIATGLYVLGTKNRELNDTLTAHTQFIGALKLAESPWLKSNIYRNHGLVDLKTTEFENALKKFGNGYDIAVKHDDLRGSLAALLNYEALAYIRHVIKTNGTDEALEKALKLHAEATKLYESTFKEKNITAEMQLKSHDWQSHQFHRGMVLCELVEAKRIKPADINPKLKIAEEMLLGALTGRKANKADDQRLGDTSLWLGRVYVALGQVEDARKYFGDAQKHYVLAFPKKTPTDADSKQLIDVRKRLAELPPLSPSASRQGLNAAQPVVPEVLEVNRMSAPQKQM